MLPTASSDKAPRDGEPVPDLSTSSSLRSATTRWRGTGSHPSPPWCGRRGTPSARSRRRGARLGYAPATRARDASGSARRRTARHWPGPLAHWTGFAVHQPAGRGAGGARRFWRAAARVRPRCSPRSIATAACCSCARRCQRRPVLDRRTLARSLRSGRSASALGVARRPGHRLGAGDRGLPALDAMRNEVGVALGSPLPSSAARRAGSPTGGARWCSLRAGDGALSPRPAGRGPVAWCTGTRGVGRQTASRRTALDWFRPGPGPDRATLTQNGLVPRLLVRLTSRRGAQSPARSGVITTICLDARSAGAGGRDGPGGRGNSRRDGGGSVRPPPMVEARLRSARVPRRKTPAVRSPWAGRLEPRTLALAVDLAERFRD